MKRILQTFCVLFICASLPVWAQGSSSMSAGDPSREFLMSCTYGVLAGTLIGAASLAFVDRPSDNLNKVARGASLGLYVGILLGAYVVYVVPGMDDEDSDNPVALRGSKGQLIFGPQLSEDSMGLQAQFSF